MNYQNADVLVMMCHQTGKESVHEAIASLDSASFPTWKNVTGYINEYKNGMNQWAEYWDDPSREDYTVPEIKKLALENNSYTLRQLEDFQTKIDSD